MNIAIDARPLVKKKTGFGYFLSNMLSQMLQLDPNNEYYLFSDREIFFDSSNYKNLHIVNYKDKPYCPKTFFFYYKLAKEIEKMGLNIDVFWGTEHIMPKGFGKKTKCILTIHDFTHILFPRSTTKYNLLITRLLYKKSLKNADTIICISNSTKLQLQELFQKEIKNKDIRMIYEGGLPDGNIHTNQEREDIREDIQKLENGCYVLFVGTIEPRKNISLLISAAPVLANSNIKVVVCGKIGWENKDIVKKLYSTDNLVYLDYVSDQEKEFLLANAFCQVQPSYYEGFGLPIVESMQKGSVVVVANNSSMKELVTVDYLKFETTDVNDFCQKVIVLHEDENLYLSAKNYCKNRGAEFSWKKAAQDYLDCFSNRFME